MRNRTIYITPDDMLRLRNVIDTADGDNRDRPYLAALKSELDRAHIVPAERLPSDVVSMNSQVRLRDGRRTWVITLVYPDAADAEQGQISVLAPLGAAILGCRVGERVEFRIPGGDLRACDILSVLFQPEAAGKGSS